ncbi:Brix domain-containing protein [Glonium stellatum]|uniref:Brix domain-containing protein n=1 Tax=Glonium stellatum TaxID=574774 RepID=A0A8E2EZ25_9PEZI|nr:Brix domain-containing protein [Glonium stellatum]
MASSKTILSSKSALPFKTANKTKRREFHIKQKKARDSIKRDERFRRRREEEKDPKLREERQARNKPITIDQKRTWDNVGGDEEDALGLAVDVDRIKRQKTADTIDSMEDEAAINDDEEDDADSMLDEDSDEASDAGNRSSTKKRKSQPAPTGRETSPTTSTGTNLDLSPEYLLSKFPTLFTPPAEPKILITTSINSTLYNEGSLLTSLFPNSTFIRRTAHRYGHKFSVREISKFASNRGYTTLIVLMEDQKRPAGLDIVHLPSGPMFHFTISNWVDGKRLPGHGNPTNHFPELILNNFRTPLGLLTAHLFRTMFPPQPELAGRQVVTLHNQRDYIFLRRHRYVFRDKRPTEKSVVGTDGKVVKGVEDIRAGLQELGPRFTLKLRRIDRGIQRASGQEWEWKAGMEKVRTRFQM